MIEQSLSLRASHLQMLCTILNYELSTVVLYLLQYYWQITIFLAAFAALLFTPYLIFILIKEKRYGYIIFFISFVIFPLSVIILFLSDHLFYLAYLQIPLPLFYFYCFMLRFNANEWLREINWKIQRETQKSAPKISDDYITLR